jgi:uroporphyrinogen decarboxylase
VAVRSRLAKHNEPVSGGAILKSRERILTALDNQQPDRVPIFELQIDEPVVLRLAALLGFVDPEHQAVGAFVHGDESQQVVDLYCQVHEQLGLDATCTVFSAGIQRIDEEHGRDKYGCVYRLSEHGEPIVVEGPIRAPEDLKGYDMASKLSLDDFRGLQQLMKTIGPDKAHFLALNDPFKISWMLRGDMSNLMMDLVWRPQFVHDMARVATDLCLAEIDVGLKLGVDGIVVEGDLAGETTTLMSPRHFREYIKPYEEELAHYAHRHGLKIIKHSDGNVWPILDDLVEAGFDGFNPVQPQCMDIGEVKAHVGEQLCLVGNIDCRHLLPFGTVEEVEQAVKETVAVAAPGGGYIISSSNSIHPGCKPENYIAMVRAAHKYGHYPSSGS